jgi:hypothetical protein
LEENPDCIMHHPKATLVAKTGNTFHLAIYNSARPKKNTFYVFFDHKKTYQLVANAEVG